MTDSDRTPRETLEDDASLATLAVGDGLRILEVVGVVLIGLIVVPPLGILAVVVVVPVVVVGLILGLLAAVLAVPYLIVHRLRGGHGGHSALVAERLRHVGHALRALAPHRIVSDAREPHRTR